MKIKSCKECLFSCKNGKPADSCKYFYDWKIEKSITVLKGEDIEKAQKETINNFWEKWHGLK